MQLSHEREIYILFPNVSCDSRLLTLGLEADINTTITPEPRSMQLIEHHLGVMLTHPDLPDLSSLKHMVDDASDDLNDVLNAIEHAIE